MQMRVRAVVVDGRSTQDHSSVITRFFSATCHVLDNVYIALSHSCSLRC